MIVHILGLQVERTKSRPLASGAMTQKQSLFLLAAHLSAGLGILLSLNQTRYS